MIRAIIFDYFGVIRTDGLKRWTTQHDINEKSAILEASRKLDTGELDFAGYFQSLSNASGQKAETIRSEMEADTGLIRDTVDIIASLQGRYLIGLLTNSESTYLRNELNKYDLTEYFDEIVISGEVGIAKPDREIYEICCQKLGVKPAEALFIDDNSNNVRGAQAIGMQAIAYIDATQLETELNQILGP